MDQGALARNPGEKSSSLAGPGGKTTLATRLAFVLDIPYHELDVIGYEGGAGPERPLNDRLRDVVALASQDDWGPMGALLVGPMPSLELPI
jgi:hypothetical protein